MKRVPLLLLLALFVANSFGQKLNKSSTQAIATGWNFININSVNATISYDGVFSDYLRTNSAGLEWPKGSGKTAVYSSGLWIIGKHKPSDSLRTAAVMYTNEYQPGKILTPFNTSTNSPSAADDPSKKEYRLYKAVRGISNTDHQNWPVHLGAPFNDVNNNGVWDSGTDSPVKWGDQILWTVSNDVSQEEHMSVGTTAPMGIELQSTFFEYDIPGLLNNTVFIRYTIINKSDADYDSVFISMWSDTDLGDANDDMVGCDTVRSLSFVYNGDAVDGGASGYGDKPPADGFVFFQGPKVSGLPSDTALFEGKKLPGYRNLPATSHAAYFGAPSAPWDDPPLRNQGFAEQAYNYQNGLIGLTGQPFINPHNGQSTKFVFPGDPATNTGWTHSSHPLDQGDVRSMISSGPFTLAKGDTQEIVGGFVIAQGADRLNSISILRSYVDIAQSAFNANFNSSVLSIEKPEDGNIPNAYSLFQNYPNPFNPTTSINYSLPTSTNVTIEIFNTIGQNVAMLVNEMKSAGNYSVRWNGWNNEGIHVPSGLYYYRLTAEHLALGRPGNIPPWSRPRGPPGIWRRRVRSSGRRS